MTGHNIYLHLLVAAAVTFSIRTLPLLLLRRPIRSRFLRSFLFYVPYIRNGLARGRHRRSDSRRSCRMENGEFVFYNSHRVRTRADFGTDFVRK